MRLTGFISTLGVKCIKNFFKYFLVFSCCSFGVLIVFSYIEAKHQLIRLSEVPPHRALVFIVALKIPQT